MPVNQTSIKKEVFDRCTLRLSHKIIDLLRKLVSIKSVAESTNVSVNTVTRLLDTVNYTTPSIIPECISIDEFKGNTDARKYQYILVGAKTYRNWLEGILNAFKYKYTNGQGLQ